MCGYCGYSIDRTFSQELPIMQTVRRYLLHIGGCRRPTSKLHFPDNITFLAIVKEISFLFPFHSFWGDKSHMGMTSAKCLLNSFFNTNFKIRHKSNYWRQKMLGTNDTFSIERQFWLNRLFDIFTHFVIINIACRACS